MSAIQWYLVIVLITIAINLYAVFIHDNGRFVASVERDGISDTRLHVCLAICAFLWPVYWLGFLVFTAHYINKHKP